MVEKTDSSAAATAFRSDLCLHSFIEAQAARTPQQPAVICGERQLTFAELNARANQLARHLQSLGVSPDTLVGLCVERSVEMAVGILGILKAGGAWLPLDPAYPKERLAYMLDHGRAPVLLTQSNLPLPPHSAKIVMLDRPEIARHGVENFSANVTPQHLAYVIYTSGSTGRPKGVMITHANLVHYVQAMSAALDVTGTARYLHTASISFSSSVRQLLLPLSQGATVVIATTDLIRDPLALFAEIQRQRVTVIDLVPSYWRTCYHTLMDLDATARDRAVTNDLQLILSASEPLPSDLPKNWRANIERRTRLVNMCGQTEMTGIATVFPIPDSAELRGHVVPIGRTIPGVTAQVLDASGRPVALGEPGELHYGGPTVGRGYLHQPDLTAATFVADPAVPGARLCRPGDQARQRPDGTLEFVGRGDQLVKIRGFRIEPGEVEAALHRHPAVRQSVVLGREDEPGEKQLVAYLLLHPQQTPALSELREFLGGQLPDYMIPAAFVTLAALPLTPTGKVDRRALPAPEKISAPNGAPLTATEETLAGIWSEILKRGQPAATDNFFEIGGQSLIATRMLSRVREVFQIELPWGRLFEAPTLAGTARNIDALRWVKNNSSAAVESRDGARDAGEI